METDFEVVEAVPRKVPAVTTPVEERLMRSGSSSWWFRCWYCWSSTWVAMSARTQRATTESAAQAQRWNGTRPTPTLRLELRSSAMVGPDRCLRPTFSIAYLDGSARGGGAAARTGGRLRRPHRWVRWARTRRGHQPDLAFTAVAAVDFFRAACWMRWGREPAVMTETGIVYGEVGASGGTAIITASVLLFALTAGGILYLARDVNRVVTNRSAAQSIAFQAALARSRSTSGRSRGPRTDERAADVAIDADAAAAKVRTIGDRLLSACGLGRLDLRSSGRW